MGEALAGDAEALSVDAVPEGVDEIVPYEGDTLDVVSDCEIRDWE